MRLDSRELILLVLSAAADADPDTGPLGCGDGHCSPRWCLCCSPPSLRVNTSTGFYRERYLLAEADPAVEKELPAGHHQNPARVIPALGTIR
jgi:hypothetical protein